MSHIVTITTQVRDQVAVEAACRRLQLPPPQQGRHKLFAEQVEGLAVRLKNWGYPVVCQLETGKLHYDTYQGRWGDPQRLDEFQQAYSVEKATLEARRQGHSVTEQTLAGGSIKLTIGVGGAV